MKLKLEQILEEFPDKNFICIPWAQENEESLILRTLSVKPYLNEDGSQFIILKYEFNNCLDLRISRALLDYSGDWRDSLRSREDINKKQIADIFCNHHYCRECDTCRYCLSVDSISQLYKSIN